MAFRNTVPQRAAIPSLSRLPFRADHSRIPCCGAGSFRFLTRGACRCELRPRTDRGPRPESVRFPDRSRSPRAEFVAQSDCRLGSNRDSTIPWIVCGVSPACQGTPYATSRSPPASTPTRREPAPSNPLRLHSAGNGSDSRLPMVPGGIALPSAAGGSARTAHCAHLCIQPRPPGRHAGDGRYPFSRSGRPIGRWWQPWRPMPSSDSAAMGRSSP